MTNRGFLLKYYIYYYPEENIFRDADGKLITNFYPLVSPNSIYLFKHQQKDMEIVNVRNGVVIQLCYPTKEWRYK